MIRFDRLWVTMEKKQVSIYQLREKTGMDRKTIQRLRKNKIVSTTTLDRICTALGCRVDEIMEYQEDSYKGIEE